ncbi:MAG: LuxR C-terminal-related transcriptional regulator, partial [Desulfovibrio sp.]|nr:LuxR C-terminal-related transcriptional regulator [Desulfovibrio sp.]
TSNCIIAELTLARIGILRGDEALRLATVQNIRHEMEQARQVALTRVGELSLAHLDMLLGKADALPDWVRSVPAIKRALYTVTQPHAVMLHSMMLLLKKRRADLYALSDSIMHTVRVMNYPLLAVYHHIFLAQAALEEKRGDEAAAQVDEALRIALPDRVYLPFAEHGETLAPLLEKRKKNFAPEMMRECLALCARWAKGAAAVRRELGAAVALTPRQEEFMRLAVAGETNSQIAARLGVSSDNVNKILRSAYVRLGARNRAEAVRIYLSKTG